MSPEEIWVEIICDSLGGMNVFEGIHEGMAKVNEEFLPSLKEAAYASKKDARGPPKSAEGRASREPQKGRSQELETMENNRFERLRPYRDNLPSEWFAFTREYYYIYSNQSFTDYTILLKVKITNSNKTAIDNFTREIENETDRSSRAFDSWFDYFRRGKGRYSWNSISTTKDGTTKRADGMDGRNIQRNSGESTRKHDGRDTQEGSGNSEITGKASQDLEFFDFLGENAEDSTAAKVQQEMSNREILANALESVVSSESDKRELRKYKSRVKALDSMEAELSEVNAKIRELSFAPGPRDKITLNELKKKKTELESAIQKKDRSLIMLEATAPLQSVLERAKKQAVAKAKEEARVKMDAQKERAREALDKQAKRYQESRKKSVEGRHKTEMRHKIQRVVSELDTLLRKGNKERNVKLGLQDALNKWTEDNKKRHLRRVPLYLMPRNTD